MRNCEIRTVPGKEVAGNWAELHPSRDIKGATFCEFDLAEEVIGIIDYVGGFYEVGIGESLRPYQTLAQTYDPRRAEDVFWRAVIEHAGSAYGAPRGE